MKVQIINIIFLLSITFGVLICAYERINEGKELGGIAISILSMFMLSVVILMMNIPQIIISVWVSWSLTLISLGAGGVLLFYSSDKTGADSQDLRHMLEFVGILVFSCGSYMLIRSVMDVWSNKFDAAINVQEISLKSIKISDDLTEIFINEDDIVNISNLENIFNKRHIQFKKDYNQSDYFTAKRKVRFVVSKLTSEQLHEIENLLILCEIF